MKLIDWKKLLKEESEETIALFVEQLKLEAKQHRLCAKEKENEIERLKQEQLEWG